MSAIFMAQVHIPHLHWAGTKWYKSQVSPWFMKVRKREWWIYYSWVNNDLMASRPAGNEITPWDCETSGARGLMIGRQEGLCDSGVGR